MWNGGAATGSAAGRTVGGGVSATAATSSGGATGRARVKGGASSTGRITTGRASRNVAAGRTLGWIPPLAREVA